VTFKALLVRRVVISLFLIGGLLAVLLFLFHIPISLPWQRNNPSTRYDHVVRTATPAPQRILHKTITLQKSVAYTFEVPAHSVSPRLHGTFKSYRNGDAGVRTSDDASIIDFFLMDEQQYHDFMRGPSEATTRAVQAAYEREVDWALPATYDSPQKFYLVFSNSVGTPKNKMVDTDFTLSF
jgi:hypothetical protein